MLRILWGMSYSDEMARRKRAEMIKELRRQRQGCEPKSSENPMYLAFSNAITGIRKVDALVAAEAAAE
jgi:hypothetical protein